MSDDELFAHLLAARAAGDRQQVGLAVTMFCWRLRDNIRWRVAMKVPEEHVDDVADSVLLSALASDFDENTFGQFRSWLNTITKRRIADHHRNPKAAVHLDPLPTEHAGDDEIWGDEPSEEFEGDTIDVKRALEQAYDELSEDHQKVIDRYVFGYQSAKEVAQDLGVGEDNVHKIAQRFRDRFKELFPDDGDNPG